MKPCRCGCGSFSCACCGRWLVQGPGREGSDEHQPGFSLVLGHGPGCHVEEFEVTEVARERPPWRGSEPTVYVTLKGPRLTARVSMSLLIDLADASSPHNDPAMTPIYARCLAVAREHLAEGP